MPLYFLYFLCIAAISDLFVAIPVVSRPRPDRERILDVVQEGRSSKLRVSWRARPIVPTCNNSKHLVGTQEQKNKKNEDSGNQSSTLLGVGLDWSKTELRLLCF